jgi:peptide/nickel transport system substrate-binding protein
MKLSGWRWFAISSVIASALAANAETRPQYGGTLRIATHAAPVALDPADNSQADSFARRSLTMLIFDTLVTVDENGRVQPSLATAWQPAPGNASWRFTVRRGVKFSDGTPLTSEIASASLRTANPSWNISADGDSLVIERDFADPELPAELAMPRNAITKRGGTQPLGTGPFHVVDWQAGQKLTLAADEDCWRGRPYLDGIEIEMGRSYREQSSALDSGRAELVEVPAEQLHRASSEGRNLSSSPPVELLALVFARDASTPDEKSLREALALSIERGSIRSVLLQSAGQPVGGILPNWISGYAFVFSTDADLPRARHAREQVRAIPAWSLGYDGNDALARLLAERIALNSKDAGLSLQPTSAAVADVRLVRIPLASVDPWVALADVAAFAGAPLPGSTLKASGRNAEDLYAAEESELATQRIIPLFYLPASYAAAPALKNWTLRPDGTWNLADAWLGSAKP